MNSELGRFAVSRRKVERAAKHFSELRSEVERYISRSPLELEWQAVPAPLSFSEIHGEGVPAVGLIAHIREDAPMGLSEIIGDVVHNLRSALDIMACDLIRAANPSFDKLRKVSFPCWRSATDRTKALDRSHIRSTSNSDIVALIDAWQPFKGGASRLYALSELDNLDKHRSIIPAMTGAIYSESNALFLHETGPDGVFDPFPTARKVSDGQMFFVGPANIMPPIGTRVPAILGLAFDFEPTADIADVVGSELLSELDYLISVVSGVITSFETGALPEFVPAPPREPVHAGNGVWTCPPEMSPDEVEAYFRRRIETGTMA